MSAESAAAVILMEGPEKNTGGKEYWFSADRTLIRSKWLKISLRLTGHQFTSSSS